MNRELLRRQFSVLLMDTDELHPMQCNVPTGQQEAFGLSTLELPIVIKVFQDPIEGIICFYLYGDCIVEFDDMATDDLLEVFKHLSEDYY